MSRPWVQTVSPRGVAACDQDRVLWEQLCTKAAKNQEFPPFPWELAVLKIWSSPSRATYTSCTLTICLSVCYHICLCKKTVDILAENRKPYSWASQSLQTLWQGNLKSMAREHPTPRQQQEDSIFNFHYFESHICMWCHPGNYIKKFPLIFIYCWIWRVIFKIIYNKS